MSGLAIIYRMVVILVPSLRYLYLLILNIWPVFRVICGSLKDVKRHVVDICNLFRVSVICARALNQVSVTNVINLFLNSSLEHRMIAIWMTRMILWRRVKETMKIYVAGPAIDGKGAHYQQVWLARPGWSSTCWHFCWYCWDWYYFAWLSSCFYKMTEQRKITTIRRLATTGWSTCCPRTSTPLQWRSFWKNSSR